MINCPDKTCSEYQKQIDLGYTSCMVKGCPIVLNRSRIAQDARDNREQDLVNICFEVAIIIHLYRESFEGKSIPEIAEWVADQLEACGFVTYPWGGSWGVLEK